MSPTSLMAPNTPTTRANEETHPSKIDDADMIPLESDDMHTFNSTNMMESHLLETPTIAIAMASTPALITESSDHTIKLDECLADSIWNRIGKHVYAKWSRDSIECCRWDNGLLWILPSDSSFDYGIWWIGRELY